MGDTSRHITYFKAENFKRFESFEMKDLGQFNLIVGDNNVGKTSVLEALLVDSDRTAFLNNLFFVLDFKNLKGNYTYRDIELFSNKELVLDEKSYSINFKWSNSSPSNGENSISIKIDRVSGTILFEGTNKFNPPELRFYDRAAINSSWSAPLIPFYLGYDDGLSQFYSQLQENRSLKKYFIDSLKFIIPNIDNIELSGPYPDNPPHLILYQGHMNASMPLALFGEGAIKIIRFLAEIIINRGGRLMIDEIDAGIHYSRFKEFWKVILKTARDYDVQLFMTTHNEECIRYFVEALSENEMKEYQKDARSITLQELPDKSVKAYTFSFENLEANVTSGNEVRGGF
jgi:AAA15 family ATPase/GTPase